MKVPRAKDLGPILLFGAASLGVLVLQRDLGTSILYFGLF
jgi:cell division protein FtsW (lipid II flippase)